MQHTFEFIADIADGRKINMHYVGKTSRMSKVDKKIREDITRVYGIPDQEITGIKMRPLKRTT